MTNIEWALSILSPFVSEKSYGEIIFQVQGGEIVNIKTVKSEKPPIDLTRQKV